MAAVKKGRCALEGDREVAMAAIKHDRSRYNRSVVTRERDLIAECGPWRAPLMEGAGLAIFCF